MTYADKTPAPGRFNWLGPADRGYLSESAKWWVRITTFVLPTLLLAAVLLQPWVEAKWMFLDPLTAAELSGDCCHTYYGFVSNLGVMLWSATAAICLFASALFFLMSKDNMNGWFALSAGLLTGWLALDDMFLLHELVLPRFGIPQGVVIAGYVGLAVAYLLSSWRIMWAADYWILLIGGMALVTSIGIDQIFHSLAPVLVNLEDGSKFLGIFCWTAFHIVTLFNIFYKSIADVETDAI